MDKPYYPTLTDDQLVPFRALEAQLAARPDLLNLPECPYPPSVKSLLVRLIAAESAVARQEAANELIDPAEDALDREIADLYKTVKQDAQTYTGSDMKDKMAFMKTANDLLTKIVDLQARRVNIRNMAKMQRAVIEAIEEYLTPEQRTAFVSKLEGFVDVS